MLLFPNAKINLGLNITERRPDGYHNLETVFYPVQLEDVLEVVCAEETKKGEENRTPEAVSPIRLHLSGTIPEGNLNENLVVKAYHLLSEIQTLPPVEVYLHKHIPSGAGLGGGSADAAFMLRVLNELFGLKLDTLSLQKLAARLGADCAFFIENKPCYATGIGDVFEPISLDLSSYYILIVKPPVFVSTREAFQLIHPSRPTRCVKEICQLPVEEWRGALVNDFEESVFPQHPELASLKEKLYATGAVYASMSGSGSSLYGIYKKLPDQTNLSFPNCVIWGGKL